MFFLDNKRQPASPIETIHLFEGVQTMNILYTTVLDTLEVIVHLLASLTYLHAEVVSNTVVKIVECTDR